MISPTTPIEEAKESPTIHPRCRCELSPTQETAESSQESLESSQESLESSQEDAPPVTATHYEPHWNHDTGKVEWQRIEEPIEVKPKPLATEKPKYNHANRRQLRQALWRIVYQAQRRKAKRQPAVCPQCMAPMLGIHLNRYSTATTPEGEPGDTVIGHDFWQCQCQPRTGRRYTCDMCSGELWQTPEEREHTTICRECRGHLCDQWEHEDASRGEALQRLYAAQAEDDAIHRLAQEQQTHDAAV